MSIEERELWKMMCERTGATLVRTALNSAEVAGSIETSLEAFVGVTNALSISTKQMVFRNMRVDISLLGLAIADQGVRHTDDGRADTDEFVLMMVEEDDEALIDAIIARFDRVLAVELKSQFLSLCVECARFCLADFITLCDAVMIETDDVVLRNLSATVVLDGVEVTASPGAHLFAVHHTFRLCGPLHQPTRRLRPATNVFVDTQILRSAHPGDVVMSDARVAKLIADGWRMPSEPEWDELVSAGMETSGQWEITSTREHGNYVLRGGAREELFEDARPRNRTTANRRARDIVCRMIRRQVTDTK